MPDTSRQGAPDTARRDNVETFEWLTGFVRRVIRRAGKQEKWGRSGERDVA